MLALPSARLTGLSLRKMCAVCALMLAFCPSAFAQNSGGGWVSQLTDQPGPFPYGVTPYDWTGLPVSSTSVSSNGTSSSGTSTAYTSYNCSGTIVGGGADRSDSVSISGAATYKWLWTPTGSNAGAPAPALYVLARASGGATLAPDGPGNGAGLSGSATFNYTFSQSAYFYGSESVVTQYKVLPASGSPNASTAVSPSLTASISGTPTGSNGVGVIKLSTAAFPIVLSSPDPMGRPDLGDGSNQCKYNGYAVGQLSVPATISAPGAGASDFSWLTAGNHVNVSIVGPAIPGEKPYTWYPSTSNIAAVTNGVDAAGKSYPTGYLEFLGLPTVYNGATSDPNSFGNHIAILKVDGSNSQSALIQTFFTGSASNWSSSDGTTPNWYYYYNQVYASPGLYDYNATSSFTDAQSPPQYPIHIANDAYNTGNIRVFDINPVAPNYVRYVGYLDQKGIYYYIQVCAHETGHQILLLQGGVYNFGSDPAHTGPISADGDNVSDVWEPNHHLNPNSPDTASAYGVQSNGDKGDNEVLADVQALPVIFQQGNVWHQDWADGGVQWGANTYSTGSPAGYYWTFHALVNGTTMVAGNSYSVHSLHDLQSQYPSLLTAVP